MRKLDIVRITENLVKAIATGDHDTFLLETYISPHLTLSPILYLLIETSTSSLDHHTPPHLTPPHLTSTHLTSPHPTSSHLTSQTYNLQPNISYNLLISQSPG